MQSAMLLLLLIGAVCGGAIVSRADQQIASQPQRQSQPPGILNHQNYGQPLSTDQGTRAPSNQLYYPTYPDYSNAGYGIKNEYQGYLEPAGTAIQKSPSWTFGILSSLVPIATFLISYATRAGIYIFHVLLFLVLGGALTTTICTFTPVCTINFLGLGINKSQVREQVAELARTYITPESVNAATVLVSRAIDKYTAMQQEMREREKEEAKEREKLVDDIAE